jgi:Fe-S cluster assembly iron-binding protein IscA
MTVALTDAHADGSALSVLVSARRPGVLDARIRSDRKERFMLTVTPAAAAAVTAILQNPDLPAGAGMRLEAGTDGAGEQAIGIAIVGGPGPDDELVSSTPDENIFLAHDLVDALDDQVLDAEIDGQNVAFTIRPQALNGRAN